MDLTNIIFPASSDNSEPSIAESPSHSMPKNSIFAHSSEYQTYVNEKNDSMGLLGWLLVGFVLICVVFIRKFQRR